MTTSESQIERGNHSKGRPVELFIAAYCLIASKNALNVWTSYVDDEGADLVLKRWQGTATLSIQVKARFVGSKGIDENREFSCKVARSTFRPAPNHFVLFTVVDEKSVLLKPIG
jgi:hypothetical protein